MPTESHAISCAIILSYGASDRLGPSHFSSKNHTVHAAVVGEHPGRSDSHGTARDCLIILQSTKTNTLGTVLALLHSSNGCDDCPAVL